MMRALLCAGLALLLASCANLGYYREGIAGQIRFYGAREPVPEVLARDGLSEDERRRLELVPPILAFAKDELALPVRGQYRDYVRLEQPAVAWSLYAAPELSLSPYRWCYFFRAFCMEYRGYFSLESAHRQAGKLAADGYETHLGAVSAFSSLGWLDDPVTSVLTALPEDVFAEVLFHELAHAVLYVDDDTAFNESFASAVAAEGLSRWLAARGIEGGSATVAAWKADQQAVRATALDLRRRLSALYAAPLPEAEKRERKHAILAGAADEYRERCAGLPEATCRAAGWFGSGLNNARLNAVATYEGWVPAFLVLIRAHDGDLAAFYRTAEALGGMPRGAREGILRALLPAQPEESTP